MPSNLRRHDEPGHVHFWTISCYRRLTFFWEDSIKRVAIAALAHIRQKHELCLVGYVVMPDHVHFLVYPHRRGAPEPTPISKVLHAFEQYIGFHGKSALRDYWREHHRLWSEPLNQWARGAFGKQVLLHTRGYDFNIDRMATLIEKLDYCHRNPITRGLVDLPEQWPWSSYRYYELGDRSLLPMDWDGQWPIVW